MNVPLLNLLPKQEKQALLNKIANEKAIHFIILITFLFILFLLFLFGLKLSLKENKNIILKQIKAIESNSFITKIKNNENKITTFNKILNKISTLDLNNSSILVEHLYQLTSITPEGIVFESLSIRDKKVNLTGLAKSRQILKDFKTLIEKNLAVKDKEIIFPLSNFETPEDINFSISYFFN